MKIINELFISLPITNFILSPFPGGTIPALSTLQGQLQFHNINFAYPMRPDIPILKDLNLVVPAGKVTAVVGSSGSGKSTLGSLALRYYDPQNGKN